MSATRNEAMITESRLLGILARYAADKGAVWVLGPAIADELRHPPKIYGIPVRVEKDGPPFMTDLRNGP